MLNAHLTNGQPEASQPLSQPLSPLYQNDGAAKWIDFSEFDAAVLGDAAPLFGDIAIYTAEKAESTQYPAPQPFEAPPPPHSTRTRIDNHCILSA